MSMYWIYDLTTWQLALLIVGAFVVVSLVGLLATRPLMRTLLGGSSQHNDLVSYFLSAVGVFYGLALGLIAVATWENFTDVDGQISKEAASLATFYRDLDGYPQPLRGKLEDRLREYTRYVIEKDFPAHRKGDTPEEGSLILDRLENEMMGFEPSRESEKITHSEAIKSLNTVIEDRRLRLESVTTGLPAALWAVVLVGAGLNVLLAYLFWTENLIVHAVLTVILATFMALLIFLTAAMDNPFRGEFSVSPDVYKMVLDKVMMVSPTP